MHWVLSFAGAASPAAAQAAATLELPALERLLAQLQPEPGPQASADVASDAAGADSPAHTLSPPHERVLASALGWPLVDGLLPLAAHAARADGLDVDALTPPGCGWALLSPAHWQVGREQVLLADPAALQLDEAAARALFDALQPLFADAGCPLLWGAPTRWYALHASLARLPSASLDRAIGQPLDDWLQRHADARLLRRLQAEAQMLLHRHPVNARREADGLPPVNSFWLSGTGVPQPPRQPSPALHLDHRLRAAALAEDWTAWAEAWRGVEPGPVAELTARLAAGQPVALTLCGSRAARRFAAQPRTWWRRLLAPRRQALAPLLETL